MSRYAAHLRAMTLTQDTVTARILAAVPPRVRSAGYAPLQGFPRTTRAALRHALGTVAAGLAVAVSHDHYLTVAGGVQNCIGLEQPAFAARGWTYLHVCPARPLLTLADPDVGADALDVLASADGRTLGILPFADVTAAILDTGANPWLLLHQLLGHSPELLAAMVAVCGAKTFFWTHDLFAHCPSIHLLRNDAAFCGGPPVRSAACGVCHAGEERPAHVARIQMFCAATRPTLLSPSQTILDTWRRVGIFPHDGAHVIPPCALVAQAPARSPDPPRAPGPLRVGFLGGAAYHKGWDVFEALALWFADDPRYAFVRLGFPGQDVPGIAHVPVEVTAADRMAMVRAIGTHAIDVVVIWSRCHESFSFTTIEALAGGAYLIVRRGAGNVAPLLHAVDPARGIAVDSDTELQALFAEGGIIVRARAAPRGTGDLRMGIGAARLLDAPAAARLLDAPAAARLQDAPA